MCDMRWRRPAYAPTSNTASHENHEKNLFIVFFFFFLSYMGMRLRLVSLWAAGAPLLFKERVSNEGYSTLAVKFEKRSSLSHRAGKVINMHLQIAVVKIHTDVVLKLISTRTLSALAFVESHGNNMCKINNCNDKVHVSACNEHYIEALY